MSARSRFAWLFFLALSLAIPSGARASGDAALRVEVDCAGPSEQWCESMSRDLRASLATRNVELVDGAETGRTDALARVEFSTPLSPLRVHIVDRLTSKELVRDVDLRELPEDGSALAAAIAVDELLSASWAELSLVRERSPTPTQGAKASAVESSARPSRDAPRVSGAEGARTWEVALGVGAESGEGLGPSYGFDGAVARRFEGLRISLGLGVRRTSEHLTLGVQEGPGAISGEMAFGRVAVDYGWSVLRRWRVGPLAALQLGHGRVSALAAPGYRGESLEGFVGAARLGGSVQVAFEAIYLRTELGGAVALGALQPTFEGRPLAPLGALEAWATLGGGVCF